MINEDSNENKSSSLAASIPSKIHAFDNRLEYRQKDGNYHPRNRFRFEIENSQVSKSALDIFKTHYENIIN